MLYGDGSKPGAAPKRRRRSMLSDDDESGEEGDSEEEGRSGGESKSVYPGEYGDVVPDPGGGKRRTKSPKKKSAYEQKRDKNIEARAPRRAARRAATLAMLAARRHTCTRLEPTPAGGLRPRCRVVSGGAHYVRPPGRKPTPG